MATILVHFNLKWNKDSNVLINWYVFFWNSLYYIGSGWFIHTTTKLSHLFIYLNCLGIFLRWKHLLTDVRCRSRCQKFGDILLFSFWNFNIKKTKQFHFMDDFMEHIIYIFVIFVHFFNIVHKDAFICVAECPECTGSIWKGHIQHIKQSNIFTYTILKSLFLYGWSVEVSRFSVCILWFPL